MRLRFVLCIAFALIGVFQIEAMAQDRGNLEKKITDLMEKLRKKEAQFLSASDEDKAAFASFLNQPDTGILRLMPREKYDGFLLVRGGGAYFSFTRLSHEYGYGSDIGLERETFQVGFAGADFGFLTDLGNAPIDSVSLESAGVQFLASFAVPAKISEAREQQQRAGAGFEANGFTYRSFLPAEVKATYALRSINYGASDGLVAFRVVRKDTDGSMILLWKVLKRYSKPELVQ